MSNTKKLFLVGPGFIGGEVLNLLHQAQQYSITTLVRRKEHGAQLQEAYNVTSVMGSLADQALITEHVSASDIVIHTATADDLPSVQAILEGLKRRAQNGLESTYIHTSGTSVLDDGAMGAFKSEKVYHDDVRAEADSVPDDAPHREIDLAIVKTQKELDGKAKIAIMTPPLIYGFTQTNKRLSIQIPTLTRFALKHGYAAHVGAGLSVESNVHVADLARGYITLLHHLEAISGAATLENPYYYCETTGSAEPSWRDLATAIGEGLHAAGKISSAEPREVLPALFGDLFGEFSGPVVGLNSRSRAVRLRELGWASREKGWRESFLEDELPEILKEETGAFQGYEGVAAS